MATVKLVFLAIMAVLAIVIFFTPMFFPEQAGKDEHFKRIKTIVRIRMGCFLVILVLLLLCVIL